MPNYDLCKCGRRKRSVSEICSKCYISSTKATDHKVCARCKIDKPFSEYSCRRKSSVRSVCKICAAEQAKEWRIENPEKLKAQKKRHDQTRTGKIAIRRRTIVRMLPNISRDQAHALAIKAFEAKFCDICGVEFNNNSNVDHCHKTGRVRGILCSSCNNGLGRFKDNPKVIRKAALYLERIGPVCAGKE